MCIYCDRGVNKCFKIKKLNCQEEKELTEAMVHNTKHDTPCIMLFDRNTPKGYIDVDYCPMCGRKLKESE